MDFGRAISLLKEGKKVRRQVWAANKEWVALVTHWSIPTVHSMELFPFGDESTEFQGFFGLMLDGSFLPWTPSHYDLVSEDWIPVE